MDHQDDEVHLPEIPEPETSAADIEPRQPLHFPKHKRVSLSTFISILLAFTLERFPKRFTLA